jgi:hypothetical protein
MTDTAARLTDEVHRSRAAWMCIQS